MRKAFGRALLCLVALVFVYFVAALIGAVVPAAGSRAKGDGAVAIHLVTGPIHYDFLLPLTPQTRAKLNDLRLAGLPVDQPNMQWVLIGWGAREFYTTTGSYSDVALGSVLKGLTGDRSVLRVDVLGSLRPDLELPSIRMSPDQLDRFLDAVIASFARTDQGTVIPLSVSGLTATDRFFEAKGRFNLFRTCNVWIGEMLRAADVRFGVWVPLPYSVTVSRWLYLSETG